MEIILVGDMFAFFFFFTLKNYAHLVASTCQWEKLEQTLRYVEPGCWRERSQMKELKKKGLGQE